MHGMALHPHSLPRTWKHAYTHLLAREGERVDVVWINDPFNNILIEFADAHEYVPNVMDFDGRVSVWFLDIHCMELRRSMRDKQSSQHHAICEVLNAGQLGINLFEAIYLHVSQ